MRRARTLQLEDSAGETSTWVHIDDYKRALSQKTELERLLEERVATLKARLRLLSVRAATGLVVGDGPGAGCVTVGELANDLTEAPESPVPESDE